MGRSTVSFPFFLWPSSFILCGHRLVPSTSKKKERRWRPLFLSYWWGRHNTSFLSFFDKLWASLWWKKKPKNFSFTFSFIMKMKEEKVRQEVLWEQTATSFLFNEGKVDRLFFLLSCNVGCRTISVGTNQRKRKKFVPEIMSDITNITVRKEEARQAVITRSMREKTKPSASCLSFSF